MVFVCHIVVPLILHYFCGLLISIKVLLSTILIQPFVLILSSSLKCIGNNFDDAKFNQKKNKKTKKVIVTILTIYFINFLLAGAVLLVIDTSSWLCGRNSHHQVISSIVLVQVFVNKCNVGFITWIFCPKLLKVLISCMIRCTWIMLKLLGTNVATS